MINWSSEIKNIILSNLHLEQTKFKQVLRILVLADDFSTNSADMVSSIIDDLSKNDKLRPFLSKMSCRLDTVFSNKRIKKIIQNSEFVKGTFYAMNFDIAKKGKFPDVLFCDIDGCLHPGGVYKTHDGELVSEFGDQQVLLEYQGILERLLAFYPEVKIVLSTNWVAHIGYEKTKSFFSDVLQEKIIGTTHIGGMPLNSWNAMSRGQQIRRYLNTNDVGNWIILDDRKDGLDTPEFLHKHSCPDENIGIKDFGTIKHLNQIMKSTFCTTKCTHRNIEKSRVNKM